MWQRESVHETIFSYRVSGSLEEISHLYWNSITEEEEEINGRSRQGDRLNLEILKLMDKHASGQGKKCSSSSSAEPILLKRPLRPGEETMVSVNIGFLLKMDNEGQ